MDELLGVEVLSASVSVASGRGVDGLRLSGGPLRHRDAPLRQLATWVGETLQTAERAAAGSSESLPLFWVQLYGLLTDVSDFVQLTVQEDHDGLCMFPLARGQAQSSPLPLALDLLTSLLDEDDLLYVEYRRHVACDPFQAKYRIRRGRHGMGHVPSALLGGRPVTIDQAECAFQRLFGKHGHDEERIGSELARRVLPALRALDAAARAH